MKNRAFVNETKLHYTTRMLENFIAISPEPGNDRTPSPLHQGGRLPVLHSSDCDAECCTEIHVEHHPKNRTGLSLLHPAHLLRHLRAADAWDLSGIGLSILCCVHCLAFPILILIEFFIAGSTGSLDVSEVGSEHQTYSAFHIFMLVAVSTFAFVALGKGYRRHQDGLPALLAIFGISCLAAALAHFHHSTCIAFLHQLHNSPMWEPGLTSIGGIFLIYAHLRNLRQRNCGCGT
jgi:hypothetical protein